MYGSRGKVGLLVPAGNRVIIPEFYRVAPTDVAFFETRMIVQGDWVSDESNFSMIDNASRGLAELKICNVDVCVLACTATSFLKGKNWDQAFVAEGEKETGVPGDHDNPVFPGGPQRTEGQADRDCSPWPPESQQAGRGPISRKAASKWSMPSRSRSTGSG